MDLEVLASQDGWTWKNQQQQIVSGPCPVCSGGTAVVRLLGGRLIGFCTSGCDKQQLLGSVGDLGGAASSVHRSPPVGPSTNGHVNGKVEHPEFGKWKLELGYMIKGSLDDVPEKDRPTIASLSFEKLTDIIVGKANELIQGQEKPLWPLPEATETEIAEEVQSLAEKAVKVFRDAYNLPAVQESKPQQYVIPFELQAAAIIANEEYLKREPVIEGLCYSSAVSMITGGKHAGKSTLARWMAICVAKGMPFLERETQQGRVLYLASEDETMVARQELLRLGWGPDDPLEFLSMSNVTEEQVRFLAALANYIRDNAVKLVAMDMLFDFARITDEMSYAQTREAVGAIQKVATQGGSHIATVHHAPKNANIGDAAVAALGSQGLAARVSPIMLVRRFGPGVHSISSTEIRDPRGRAIADSRLVRNEDGSVTLGGVFKNYMLAEVYAPRVREIIESEPGTEYTATEIAEAVGVTYEVGRATLSFLFKNELISRSGTGKKGKPYRYCVPLTEISPANQKTEDSDSTQGRGKWGISHHAKIEEQGRFGYKEKLIDPEPNSGSEGYGMPDKYGISKGD